MASTRLVPALSDNYSIEVLVCFLDDTIPIILTFLNLLTSFIAFHFLHLLRHLNGCICGSVFFHCIPSLPSRFWQGIIAHANTAIVQVFARLCSTGTSAEGS